MFSESIAERIKKIDREELEAIALMGSYARGEACKYSDIDIVCFLKEGNEGRLPDIEIVDSKYLVISYVTREETDKWFCDPEKATECISGLRQSKVIWDPNGYLSSLKKRAEEFKWDSSLQEKANNYASRELVSWVEEVHKALQGLLFNDIGRMLNGLYGLTYGLFKVVRVQKGILLTSDNSFFKQVIDYFGEESEFAILGKEAFGIDNTLEVRERVISGLKLFDLITDMLVDILNDDDKEAILLVKDEIRRELCNKLEKLMDQ
ncbi:nucleotidyltransferase domain-containing protein [Caloranaerobacter ferrireducens]|uniref:nucleotidyltransferase domain-containing protein n=1 Tax=Caloranaerobacter ferrireducens TaxID=1323370 RepID=UPI00084D6981|nr:nucleotidyltransferase domain-containing protein [Caloranaerobacter ferrireducens]